jgi:T5SS/PEP-CTERM-associated repeat protein
VGDYGSGTLNVEAGGVVTSRQGDMGSDSGSTGVATVKGPGSRWNISEFLYVGRFYSSGTLNIESGGVVNSRQGEIGGFYSTTGVATVRGSGSQWNNSHGLFVGYSGHGTLNVEAGGVVNNLVGLIGRWDDSTGVATVTGEDSQWNNSESLYVGGDQFGPGGTGELTVQDGGLVRSTNRLKVWTTGTVNLDGGTIQAGTLDATPNTFTWTAGRLSVDYHFGNLVQNAGNLVVGNTSGRTVISGDYTLSNHGALEIELASAGGVAGMDFDRLDITGAANLGGDLIVSLSGGFAPAWGTEFMIVSAPSVGGQFATEDFSAAPLASGLQWDVLYNANGVTLKVVSAGLAGDFNADGFVDAADYAVWRKGMGTIYTPEDFNVWRAHFGQTSGGPGAGGSGAPTVPEPTTALILIFGSTLSTWRRLVASQVPTTR